MCFCNTESSIKFGLHIHTKTIKAIIKSDNPSFYSVQCWQKNPSSLSLVCLPFPDYNSTVFRVFPLMCVTPAVCERNDRVLESNIR